MIFDLKKRLDYYLFEMNRKVRLLGAYLVNRLIDQDYTINRILLLNKKVFMIVSWKYIKKRRRDANISALLCEK